jgi:hypothetical protein
MRERGRSETPHGGPVMTNIDAADIVPWEEG